MLNQCNFIGNLGKDPEIRAMQNGDEVANFSIACTERWKNKQGEKKEKTEWVNVVVWGPLVQVVKNYLNKGSKVYISGKMATRKWQDQSGNDRYSTEVVLQGFGSNLVMLDSKSDKAPQEKDYSQSDFAKTAQANEGKLFAPAAELDDDIMF